MQLEMLNHVLEQARLWLAKCQPVASQILLQVPQPGNVLAEMHIESDANWLIVGRGSPSLEAHTFFLCIAGCLQPKRRPETSRKDLQPVGWSC